MQWRGRRQSTNVDDRRGMKGGLIAGGGILGVIALVVNLLLGGDPEAVNVNLPGDNQAPSPQEQAAQDEQAGFVKVVLADTEDVWTKLFADAGSRYQPPTLVLFS